MTDVPKTYVFFGHDGNNSFLNYQLYARMQKLKQDIGSDTNIVPIFQQEGESIEAAVKRAHIPKNSNVVLAAHGDNQNDKGVFFWDDSNKGIPYERFFKALPQNTNVILEGCRGTAAINHEQLASLPKGSVVIPASPAEKDGFASITGLSRTKETVNRKNDVAAYYIETLDAINPVEFQRLYRDAKYEQLTSSFDRLTNPRTFPEITPETFNGDPSSLLPTRIGIAGDPAHGIPSRIVNMHAELDQLVQNKGTDKDALHKATARVTQLFDNDNFYDKSEYKDDAALKRKINQVEQKIANHEPLKGIEEYRIGYAITAQYLQNKGELSPAKAVETATAQAAWNPEQNITKKEQDFLKVAEREMSKLDEGVRKKILDSLKHVFMETDGNDKFHAKSDLNTYLKNNGVKTQDWTR